MAPDVTEAAAAEVAANHEIAANSSVPELHQSLANGLAQSLTNGLGLPVTIQEWVRIVKSGMERIFQHLREGRNLGPLSILALVLIYSLLSPHLPAPIHNYIYHIAH
jgi:hypothetical protein